MSIIAQTYNDYKYLFKFSTSLKSLDSIPYPPPNTGNYDISRICSNQDMLAKTVPSLQGRVLINILKEMDEKELSNITQDIKTVGKV